MNLVEPTIKLEWQFRQMAEDFAAADEGKFAEELAVTADFEDYLTQKSNCKAGINLKAGYVPFSTYWLVDDKDSIIGVSSLRHYLNGYLENHGGHIGYHISPAFRRKGFGTELLRLTLDKARELKIPRALVTCDVDNIGSNKVIQNNGGVFEDQRHDDSGVAYNRYWIELGA